MWAECQWKCVEERDTNKVWSDKFSRNCRYNHALSSLQVFVGVPMTACSWDPFNIADNIFEIFPLFTSGLNSNTSLLLYAVAKFICLKFPSGFFLWCLHMLFFLLQIHVSYLSCLCLPGLVKVSSTRKLTETNIGKYKYFCSVLLRYFVLISQYRDDITFYLIIIWLHFPLYLPFLPQSSIFSWNKSLPVRQT